jgi:hypothetical protein
MVLDKQRSQNLWNLFVLWRPRGDWPARSPLNIAPVGDVLHDLQWFQ